MIGIISTGVQTMVGGIVLLAFGGLGLRYALTWRAKAARRGLTPSEPSGLARRWDRVGAVVMAVFVALGVLWLLVGFVQVVVDVL